MKEAAPPPCPRSRTLRWLLIAAGGAILLAAIALSILRVPDNHHGFRRLRGAERWTVLEPGLHVRLPLLHEVVIGPDALAVRDRIGLATREGSAVDVLYQVTARVSGETLARSAEEARTPPELLAAAAERVLREEVGSLPAHLVLAGAADPRLGSALVAFLSRQGFGDVSATASAAPAAEAARPGERAEPVPRRTLDRPIVIVGLDGADWQIAEPLLRAGRLPNLGKLRDSGLWGHLRSSTPMLSPLLWTTAATGKTPDEHGIVDFLIRDPASGEKVPITASFRRARALWNIFSGRGLTSAFVAWWATFPAEPVRGEMISDRVAYSLFGVGEVEGSGAGLVYPPSLWPSVRARKVAPADISGEEIRRYARVSGEEIARARALLRSGEDDASKDRLAHLLKILASTRTYHAITLDLLDRGQPDLLGVYYQGIDEVSHRFAHCTPPPLPFCEEGDAERFGGAIDAFYEYQDELLGELLARVDPDSYILVLSDHGFRNGADRPNDVAPDIEGKPGKWHRLYGIGIVSGPGIRPRRLDHLTLLEIAPTVLRLAGLPRALDMPGRILASPEGGPQPGEAIASYENESDGLEPVAVASSGVAGAGEEEMLENLRSLGYIGGGEEGGAPPPAAPVAGTAEGTEGGAPRTLTYHGNVGALYFQKGDLERAEQEFQAALAMNPVFYPALMGLVEIRVQQERFEEALALTRRAMEKSRSPEPGVYVRFADLAHRAGAGEEGRGILERLREERPDVPEVPVALGILAHYAGRDDETEIYLREALEMDPANGEALTRLTWLARRQGREASLEPLLRRAVEANPGSVLNRNLFGLLLERKGDPAGAEREFKAALALAPDFGGTMANLGALYGRTGRLEEAATLLRRALEIEPGDLRCRVNLGAALGKLGRVDEALEVLLAGMERTPSSPELLNALAVAYAHKGETKRAEDLLRRSLSLRPEQPEVRSMLRELTEPS